MGALDLFGRPPLPAPLCAEAFAGYRLLSTPPLHSPVDQSHHIEESPSPAAKHPAPQQRCPPPLKTSRPSFHASGKTSRSTAHTTSSPSRLSNGSSSHLPTTPSAANATAVCPLSTPPSCSLLATCRRTNSSAPPRWDG